MNMMTGWLSWPVVTSSMSVISPLSSIDLGSLRKQAESLCLAKSLTAKNVTKARPETLSKLTLSKLSPT